MFEGKLTKKEQAIADLLHERKPLYVQSDVMQATASTFWYSLVRDMADRMFTRPTYAYPSSARERNWEAFVQRAGYYGDGGYKV